MSSKATNGPLHMSREVGSHVAYDAMIAFWRVVTNIFFREIRPRGAFNIPRDGAVIFAVAPHHNQVCYRVLYTTYTH